MADRAGRKISDVFEEKVVAHGRALIMDLSILVKLTDIYASTNEAISNAAERFLENLKELLCDSEELTMKMMQESFFIEELRVKSTAADIDTFSFLAKALDKRGIGVLTFKASITPEVLIDSLYEIKTGQDIARIQESLQNRGLDFVSIEGEIEAYKDEGLDLSDTRLTARRSYARMVSALNDVYRSLKAGRSLNIKRAKKAVQSMVDGIIKDGRYVVGLTRKDIREDYYYIHPVNVSILSMAVAARLGMGKYEISKIGMAALFHDIGKPEPEPDAAAKAAKGPGSRVLSPEEIESIRDHPLQSVRLLLRTRGLNEISMLSMLVAFEHHMNLDMMGYPDVSKVWSQNVYSRIVRIADEFDTLVSGKVFRCDPMSVSGALEFLHSKSGTAYDPTLVKAFIGLFA